jgi:LysM repeat protein
VALAPVNPVTLPPAAPTSTKSGASAPVSTTSTPAVLAPEAKPAVAIADYMVKKGDSLFRIAKNANTTVAKIKELNGLTKDNLKIGQTIKIPEGTTMAKMESSVTSAPVTSPAPNKAGKKVAKAAAPAKASSGTYTVVKGDSLYRIAKRYKVSPNAIMAANGIKDPTKLVVGKTITIPGTAEKRVVTEQRETAKPLNVAPQKTADIAMNNH